MRCLATGNPCSSSWFVLLLLMSRLNLAKVGVDTRRRIQRQGNDGQESWRRRLTPSPARRGQVSGWLWFLLPAPAPRRLHPRDPRGGGPDTRKLRRVQIGRAAGRV